MGPSAVLLSPSLASPARTERYVRAGTLRLQ